MMWIHKSHQEFAKMKRSRHIIFYLQKLLPKQIEIKSWNQEKNDFGTIQQYLFSENRQGCEFQEIVASWCSGYHYCTTSFNKAWIQVLDRFKSYSRRVGDFRWWESLTMALARNKAKRLSSVNHATKTIHHR